MSEKTLTKKEDVQAPKSEDQKREDDEERRAFRQVLISRLDAGYRNILLGHGWSEGDSVASETAQLPKHLLFLLHAYVQAHGIADSGKTGETDQATYNKVSELLVDLSNFLMVEAKLDKQPNVYEIEYEIIPTLEALEKKYSKKNGVEIYENPPLLKSVICEEILKIAPKLITQISTVVALDSGRSNIFTPQQQNATRFHRPDLDASKR